MAALCPISSMQAQSQADASGHWEGHIDANGVKVSIAVDLSKKDGNWSGTIDIPGQQLKDFALSNISVEGSSVSFVMAEGAGDTAFKGTLAQDGKTISGNMAHGDKTLPFTLERVDPSQNAGKAYGATPDKGMPGQGLEGYWQGNIEVNVTLRVVLKVKKSADGSFAASIDSPDQGVEDLTVDTITFKDGTLHFEINRISASFEGKVNADGAEISGEWQQGGASLPLVFKRLDRKS